jgi:hypothetical protein
MMPRTLLTARTLAALLLVVLVPACDGDAAGQGPGKAAVPVHPQIPEGQERVHLCLSGVLRGHLEPCGCASGQLGGLARRAFYQQSSAFDLRIEGGDLIGGTNELDYLKFYKAVEILSVMGHYDAFGVSAQDLQLNYADWSSVLGGLSAPVVASDLESAAADWPGKPFIEKAVRTQTVRIASLTMTVPPSAQQGNGKVTLLPPGKAWARALQDCKPATLRVLLVHADSNDIVKLVPTLTPPPDLVVGITDDHHEPPGDPTYVGVVPIVYPGVHGRLLLDVTLARLPDGPRIGYHIVELAGSKTTPSAGQDQDVRQSILQHRIQVAQDGVLQKLAEQQPTPNGASYVGAQMCQGCHLPAYQKWQASKHAAAWATLVDAEKDPKRYGWPVTAYPDCVGCHVVGYGQKSGFVDASKTPGLGSVGCEACHGPAGLHVQNPVMNKLGKVADGLAAKRCIQCHDSDQSPDFEYLQRWKLIEHGR